MKSYNNLFEKVVTEENIKKAIWKASRRKRSRSDVARVFDDIGKEVKVIQKMLVEESYIPGHGLPHKINEHSCRKEREIVKPHFKYDQIVHHAVIQVLEPIFLRGMYEYTHGSVPKRGAHGGAFKIMKWMRTDVRGTKYCLKCDIRHFYASVDKDLLMQKLAKKIRDKKMLRLLRTIIDSSERGLPLGYYTSQWFANFLLQDLDHYIKQELGAEYYVRYADDIVILGPNKKKLHKYQTAIEAYLNNILRLRMKRNWQVFRTIKPTGDAPRRNQTIRIGKGMKKEKPKVYGRALDFMGFQFDHKHLILRKSSLITATRKAAKIAKKKRYGKSITWHDATAMMSHLGKIRHTETRRAYEEMIKPDIDVKKLKKIISKHSRKEKERENLKLDRARRISGNAAA